MGDPVSSRLKFDQKHQWHRSQFAAKDRKKRYRQPAKVQVYR